MSHSTRTWWWACSGTLSAHHRCTRAMSSSGRAIRSPAVGGLGCGGECFECDVESLLATPVGLMVGFGGHGPDQLVQVVVGGGEDGAIVVGADLDTSRSQSMSSNVTRAAPRPPR